MAPSRSLRLLVVNGCSMTYGAELRSRETSCWGGLVAQHLDLDFVNLAACAGSNNRLVRTTVEQLPRLTGERGLHPEEVLFLGMWTRLNRFEAYGEERDSQGWPGLADSFDDGLWCRIHPRYVERNDARSIAWYRHVQSDFGDRSTFMLNWILLDAWLAGNGYRYGFLWAFDPDPQVFEGLPVYEGRLDRSRLLGADRSPYGGPTFFSIGQALDDLGPYGHPLERSHDLFVENHVLDWVCQLCGIDVARDRSPSNSSS